MGPDSNLYDLLESLAQFVKYKDFYRPIQKEQVLSTNSTMHLYTWMYHAHNEVEVFGKGERGEIKRKRNEEKNIKMTK